MQQELRTKLDRIRTLMAEKGLDAVYLKRQDSFAWLTLGGINYVGLGDMGNCGLLITADGMHAITNVIEAQRMIDEERLEELGYEVHFGPWHDVTFEADCVRKLVPGGTVGCDHGSSLGPNAANDIKLLRFSLTPQEVTRYLEGGYLASRAIEETICSVRPGDTELETIGRLAKRARTDGLDIVSAMCASDERISSYRHPVPTEKVIRERVQLGGNLRYKGLIVCCTRYFNFVPVTDALRAQYRANVEIDCTLMASSIPGNTYVSALEAGKKAYADRGYAQEFEKHHQGGPIGYAGRDYRVDFTTPGVIQQHQAFCWNPSITGTKSEDTIIVSSEGILPVSRPVIAPRMELNVMGHTFVRPMIWEG